VGKALKTGFWTFFVGRGVYPPVAKESVRKDKEIKGIRGVPLEHDGDEGMTSD
jgi:hypothetical protein